MGLKEPYRVYTAASNVEAQMIAVMLNSVGIESHAEEDRSGVSLWHMGTISQFHQPNVWVEKSMATRAAELIEEYEERRRERAELEKRGGGDIHVECEECGQVSTFPKQLDGTTQECAHCRSYLDVGELDWGIDFGEDQ